MIRRNNKETTTSSLEKVNNSAVTSPIKRRHERREGEKDRTKLQYKRGR